MLSYEEALKKIEETVKCRPVQTCPLEEILDHVLARPVRATFPLPRFDNSAMDGYGFIHKDLDCIADEKPGKLELVGTIEAGSDQDLEIKPGQAVKIFTGAKVPDSVDTVVMREYCQEDNGSLLVDKVPERGANIRVAGEEYKLDDLVLEAGLRITPPVLGLIASFGFSEFPVYEMPTIAILGTGSELVAPGQELSGSQIYDSNSYAISAAIESLGLRKPLRLHAQDSQEDLNDKLNSALSEVDLVITTGGVSVGDKDLVKEVLEKNCGVETVFWRARVKPGKPVYFGKKDSDNAQKLIFGLPGNPVSALITFHLFVKPALALMQGMKVKTQPEVRATIEKDRRKKRGRLDFVRGILSCTQNASLNTLPTTGQDSHMLSGLAKANCLIHFEEDSELLEAGTVTTVQNLNWRDY